MLLEKQHDPVLLQVMQQRAVKTEPGTASLGLTHHLQALTHSLEGRHNLGGAGKAPNPLIKTIPIKQTHCCPFKEMTAHDPVFQELFVSVTFFKIQVLSLEQNVSHSYTLAV